MKNFSKHFRQLIFNFCSELTTASFIHDRSKWSEKEMPAFVASRDSLRCSTTGQDEDYQKHFKSEAIQHHVTKNAHHPEYWDAIGKKMPISAIIMMFFDWYSRSLQKGNGLDGFWEYNLKKLEKQSHAIPMVILLREHIENKEVTK